MRTRVVLASATTLAVRGAERMSAISPKLRPGPMVAIFWMPLHRAVASYT
tara:strand:+ start:483 stop:632 length:150 start_codon:yes stop_codon:yes gene_type:complete